MNYDEEEEVPQPMQVIIPSWPFRIRDIIGIGFSTLGGVFSALSQGSTMVAQEFFASAQFSRQKKAYQAQIREQRRLGKELESLMMPQSNKGDQP